MATLLAGASCLAGENRAATETWSLRLHPSEWYPHIRIHSPETCFAIGNALMHGKPDSSDTSDAAYWLRRAARKGHIAAAYQLAEFLIPSSEDEHEEWLEFAAEQGHREAQLSLAMTYSSQGEWEQSVYWLTRASANHNARAMLELGMYCELGFGTPVNQQDALFWYENAYKTPYDFHTSTKLYAARELVSLYCDMPPTPQNIIAAIRWYNRAARQDCNMQRLQNNILDNQSAISGIRIILRFYGWRDRKYRTPFAR
ncbi:sel1 repeat family protein [Akkermansia glycaniphila]|uniref:tetratricopeptide repeat protein n=1 Tax=Akkermansia glycaniphila TaxID=1679444 RepID=UPI001C0161DD|nr:tetratricopeptide repeat protein [Akkermansia glycaniphila]MBT9450668.1 sel1 repeat family protein [Akkermansia glycaniphila]